MRKKLPSSDGRDCAIQVRLPGRKGGALLSLFLLGGCLLLVSGCARPPGGGVDSGVTSGIVARYRADQALRRSGALASGWQAEGVLDLDTPKAVRRHRMTLWGEGVAWARLVLFGPFHDIAGELQLSQEWIRLSDPGKREVVEVPATAAGMQHLTGLALLPEALLELVQGRAEASAKPVADADGTAYADTTAGDHLQIDPATGHLLERRGLAPDGTPYVVQYRWGDGVLDGIALPEEVRIRLGDDARFVIRVRAWSPHDGKADRATGFGTIPRGFALRRPLG
ncbi:MAG: hypothetical protein HQL66_00185 [Magnetococcales bacterium]|nr:hypothetical protein [Magnetococcales bacterium]